MMAELAQPVKLVARWPGHGDLRIVVDGAYTYLRADDVEMLASIPALGSGKELIDSQVPVVVLGDAHYLLEDAIARTRRADDPALAASFVAWLDEVLPDLLAPETVAAARPVESFTRGITVRHAARRLSEMGVRIGRTGLFTTMQALGWTRRVGDAWALTSLPLDRGWAVTRPVLRAWAGKTDDGQTAYEQIYILPAGIDELAHQLSEPDEAVTLPPVTIAPTLAGLDVLGDEQ